MGVHNKLSKENNNCTFNLSQLKAIRTYAKNNFHGEYNKDIFLGKVQELIGEHNKELKSQLKKFIGEYIKNLNKYELDDLWKKIYKITSLIQETTFFKENEKNYSDKLIDLIIYPEEHKIAEVLFYLIYNFMLLPPYVDQVQFNKALKQRIDNLDNFIYNFFDNYSFFIKPIDTGFVFDELDLSGWEEPLIISKYLKHPYIEKITLNVYLPSFFGEHIENKDKVSFILSIKNDKINGIDMYSLINTYFEIKANERNGEYLVGSYPELDVYYDITKESINNLDEFCTYFDVYIYTKPKNLGADDRYFYDYIANSLLYLEKELLNFSKILTKKGITDILLTDFEGIFEFLNEKKQQGEVKNPKQELKDELKNLLDRYFPHMNKDDFLNNLDINFDKIDTLKQKFLELINKNIYPDNKIPEIIDFNGDTFGTQSGEKNTDNGSEIVFSNSFSKFKVLKEVTPTDVVDKLFLDSELKEKVDMLENYLKSQEEFQNKLLKAPKGAILYGPAGTGKTETVKYLTKKTGRKVLYVDISNILSMRLGESEKKIKQMFEEYYSILKTEPAILFIDEADGFFGKRGSFDNQDGVRSIALQELEGFATNSNIKNGFIFLGTNFLDNIDKALKQRFSFYLKYDLPSESKRKEYIEYMMEKISKEKQIKTNFDVEKIVGLTKGFSYRELFNMFNNALMQVIFSNKKLITTEDIQKAIRITKENEKGLDIGFIK